MIVVNFRTAPMAPIRTIVVGNCGCRTEASNMVLDAFLGCEIISTSTTIGSCFMELIPLNT